MTEQRALSLLRNHDPDGLAWFMDRYTHYVGAVVWSILGGRMSVQDAEEVSSDVFVALWKNAEKPRPGKVKAYLSAIARCQAINKLRDAGQELPLEEDLLVIPDEGLEERLEQKEQAQCLRRALMAMKAEDREIFLRHYYYGQTGPQIAAAMHMSPAAVRQRLKRGRDKLRGFLAKGGVLRGNTDL